MSNPEHSPYPPGSPREGRRESVAFGSDKAFRHEAMLPRAIEPTDDPSGLWLREITDPFAPGTNMKLTHQTVGILLGRKDVRRQDVWNLLWEAEAHDLIMRYLDEFAVIQFDGTQLVQKLLDSGDHEVLARCVGKFPRGTVDMQFVFESLVTRTRVELYVIAPFLASGINPAYLARRLMETGREASLQYNLNLFPEGTVDIQELLESFRREGRIYLITKNLKQYPPDLAYRNQLAAQLFKTDPVFLLRHVSSFPTGCVDVKKIVRRLIANGDIWPVERLMDSLPAGTVDMRTYARTIHRRLDEEPSLFTILMRRFPETIDPRAYADKLLRRGHVESVACALEAFPRGSVNVDEFIRQCLGDNRLSLLETSLTGLLRHALPNAVIAPIVRAGHANLLARQVHAFPSHSFDAYVSDPAFLVPLFEQTVRRLSPEQAERAATDISPTEALAQERYDLLWFWMSHVADASSRFRALLEPRAVRAQLDRLRAHGRERSFGYLKRCARLSGIPLSESDRDRVSVPEASRRSEGFSSKVAHCEVAEHYADEFVSMLLGSIGTSAEFRSASVRERLEYERLGKAIALRLRDRYAWVREYLFEAVVAESMTSQPREGLFVSLPAARAHEQMSREEILDFFSSVNGRFFDRRSQEDFGGLAWGRISEAAYEMWVTEIPVSKLIDRVVDLEHNSGSVLSKSEDRLRYEKTALHVVLQAKRDHADFRQALLAMAPVLPPELVERLQDRVWAAVRLARAAGVSV